MSNAAAFIMTQRRVVVTGMGIVSPLGKTLKDTWSNLLANVGAMTTLEEALVKHQGGLDDQTLERELKLAQTLPCQVAAPVRDFYCDNRTPRFVQMGLEAGAEAYKHSALDKWLDQDTQDPEVIRNRSERIGVCIGSGMSSVREIWEAVHTVEEKGLRRLSPHFVPKVLSNSAAGRLSLEYGLRGPNHSASTACAAGSHAIGDAMRCIQHDDADIMLAGGAESCIDSLSMAGFCRLRALSTAHSPNESSRPFDKLRDGFVMGEGSAVLVLEEREHAMARNAPILAEIIGYGLSGDAYHITAPDENGSGAERAMKMALGQAGIDVSQVGYVNAHATSTPKGDEIESMVIDRVLQPSDRDIVKSNPLFVSSTKGATGHLLGAAGAVEAAVTIMTLVDKVIPPTKNLNEPDGDDAGFQHVTETTSYPELEIAISNSFGFGGTNASLIFKSTQSGSL